MAVGYVASHLTLAFARRHSRTLGSLLRFWEQRVPRLIIEVDSEIVVKILHSGINDSHPLSFLARLCYDFFSRDWIVRIMHTYREANRVADELADYAFSLSLGFHLFTSSPTVTSVLLMEDANGSSARFVNL
ncbi:unnamed protein product [Microthlaspi erraticum]|uniref:RNase H type-1 domain-containing protein n=1 Tax=Microthlaspi erraticum TaxID=1685480 RepID=A0A6D2K591_9BRAS|nr:unnamed protein product [Microthlaspi erraticum]